MVRLGNCGLEEIWASAVLRISSSQTAHEEPQEPPVLGSRSKVIYVLEIIFLTFSISLSCSNEMMMEAKGALSEKTNLTLIDFFLKKIHFF